MKTIRQELISGLQDLRERGCIPIYEEDDFNSGRLMGFEEGFKAAIKFAQTLISVDSELPPEDGLDYLLYNEKWKHADINPHGIRYGFYSSDMDDNWTHVYYSMYMDEYITAHDAPTHWRPIELK